MQKPPELPPDDEAPPEKPGKFVSPKKPLPPGKPGAGKKPPTPPLPPKKPKKPGQNGDDKKRGESLVFRTTNDMKNQTLLEARRVICEVASSMGKRKPGAASGGPDDSFDVDGALAGEDGPGAPDGFGDPAGAEGDMGGPGMDGPPDDFPPMDMDGPTGAPSAAPGTP